MLQPGVGLRTHRGRGAAAAAVTAALAAAGSVTMTSPAQSAPPSGDCAAPADISSLAAGDAVTGKTVTGVDSPTAPVDFDGTVLGVLADGIAPGIDMVMVKVDIPDADVDMPEVHGIWQGMSGSPVYDGSGDLIGAVAYGLSWGPSWVAGVTPFSEMNSYLDDPAFAAPRKIDVTDAQARTIARSSTVTRTQAEQGFQQLAMPMSYNGISSQRMKQVRNATGDGRHGKRYFKHSVAAGVSGAAADATADDIVAGGNLAASISYGDITAAGVGTATSICEGRLVGFGHPMTFGGKVSLGLAPADALYIQGESLGAAFKLANIGAPVGTITDDHLTGITGAFGAVPDSTDITSAVTYGDRNRTGTSHSLNPDYNANVTFSQVLANQDRVLDAIQPGSADMTYHVTGTDAEGAPFDISFADLYESDYDISFESIWDIGDVTWILSRMNGVALDTVDVTTGFTDDTDTWRLQTLEQRVGGEWSKVSRRQPAFGSRGDLVKLRATLVNGDETQLVPLEVKVPKDAKREGYLYVVGGGYLWNNDIYQAETPAEMAKALASAPHNNQVQASLGFYSRHDRTVKTDVSDPQSHVVYGAKRAMFELIR